MLRLSLPAAKTETAPERHEGRVVLPFAPHNVTQVLVVVVNARVDNRDDLAFCADRRGGVARAVVGVPIGHAHAKVAVEGVLPVRVIGPGRVVRGARQRFGLLWIGGPLRPVLRSQRLHIIGFGKNDAFARLQFGDELFDRLGRRPHKNKVARSAARALRIDLLSPKRNVGPDRSEPTKETQNACQTSIACRAWSLPACRYSS